MKQFVLDHLTHHLGTSDRIAGMKREHDGHDLFVTLADGTLISMCVINRAVRVTEIRQRYEQNTRAGVHTLFIIDGRMLPADKETITPPSWMLALHTLTLGRIYAYTCDGRDVTIRPLHMLWKWGQQPRSVEYGQPIAVDTLRGERLSAATREIDGDFAVAHFGEGAFWKQQTDADEARFDYSWRNWSYGNARRSTREEEQEYTWDSWEEFQRHYAETPHSGDADWKRTGSDARREKRPERGASPVARHYALLGIPVTATLDEVKQAYRRMARAYHPDMHPNEKEKYTAKMADINTAFEAILKAHD
jgi:hypothetical protein